MQRDEGNSGQDGSDGRDRNGDHDDLGEETDKECVQETVPQSPPASGEASSAMKMTDGGSDLGGDGLKLDFRNHLISAHQLISFIIPGILLEGSVGLFGGNADLDVFERGLDHGERVHNMTERVVELRLLARETQESICQAHRKEEHDKGPEGKEEYSDSPSRDFKLVVYISAVKLCCSLHAATHNVP